MGITFPNKEKFFRQLLSVVPEAEKELAEANEKSATAFAEMARRLAPVETGKLRDSIRVSRGDNPTAFVVEAGGSSTTNDRGYDYAVGQEFGTEDTPAQPFFWPSFRANKKPAKGRATRALKKAIKAKGFRSG